MKDYSELKMLAEKATPGPWHIDSHGMTMTSMESFKTVFNHHTDRPSVRHEETGNLSNWRNDWDASYIATANPKVILDILEELESLKKDAARYRYVRNCLHRETDILVTSKKAAHAYSDLGVYSCSVLDEIIDEAILKEDNK